MRCKRTISTLLFVLQSLLLCCSQTGVVIPTFMVLLFPKEGSPQASYSSTNLVCNLHAEKFCFQYLGVLAQLEFGQFDLTSVERMCIHFKSQKIVGLRKKIVSLLQNENALNVIVFSRKNTVKINRQLDSIMHKN